MIRAVLDTCVLFRPLLCDTLLCLAEEELFAPLWSADILAELRRNLLRYGIAESAVNHRIDQMVTHFPDAEVLGYAALVPAMTTASSDRHVLAAAVRGGADAVVTDNLKDFPPAAAAPHGVSINHHDEFLLDLHDADPVAVRRALVRQVSRYRRQPRTMTDLLEALGRPGHGCVRFAATLHAR